MANNTISFRGEINEMSAAYFIRELERMPARSNATVYLHTPGGDIYAGGEMVNALRTAMKRGCKFDIEVGSLCASMGASLLAAARAAGCKAVAHSNSEVMFHGCWTVMLGGADELTDQAKAMRDFNAVVQRDLDAIGITDTDEWFAADRQKWLNAQEMKELGLVDSIVEDSAKDADDLKDNAVKIAASLNHIKDTPTMEEPKNDNGEPVNTNAEPTAPVVDKIEMTAAELEAKIADAVNARADELANERFAGLQAKHDKMISDLTKERDELSARLDSVNAELITAKESVEKLEHDLADTRDQLAKSEQNREAVVTAALAAEPELPTYAEGIAKCKTLQERAEFLREGKFKTK